MIFKKNLIKLNYLIFFVYMNIHLDKINNYNIFYFKLNRIKNKLKSYNIKKMNKIFFINILTNILYISFFFKHNFFFI